MELIKDTTKLFLNGLDKSAGYKSLKRDIDIYLQGIADSIDMIHENGIINIDNVAYETNEFLSNIYDP